MPFKQVFKSYSQFMEAARTALSDLGRDGGAKFQDDCSPSPSKLAQKRGDRAVRRDRRILVGLRERGPELRDARASPLAPEFDAKLRDLLAQLGDARPDLFENLLLLDPTFLALDGLDLERDDFVIQFRELRTRRAGVETAARHQDHAEGGCDCTPGDGVCRHRVHPETSCFPLQNEAAAIKARG